MPSRLRTYQFECSFSAGLFHDLHEADDGNDLDNGEDELGLTVTLNPKHIDNQNNSEEEGDEDGSCQCLVPVSYSQGRGNDLEGKDRQPLHGITRGVLVLVDGGNGHASSRLTSNPWRTPTKGQGTEWPMTRKTRLWER